MRPDIRDEILDGFFKDGFNHFCYPIYAGIDGKIPTEEEKEENKARIKKWKEWKELIYEYLKA
jgi:hypothetical protein